MSDFRQIQVRITENVTTYCGKDFPASRGETIAARVSQFGNVETSLNGRTWLLGKLGDMCEEVAA